MAAPDPPTPGPLSQFLGSPLHLNRSLMEGDVIREFDGSYHYIQYVNTSGAYAVPLSAVNREIKGTVVAFTAGGKTISARAGVEIIHPLVMGGSSPEYQRYVRMASASGKVKVGAMTKEAGASFAEFDSEPADLDTPDGHAGYVTVEAPMTKDEAMAKKAAVKAKGKPNGAVRKEKAPKTVRSCACGCGTETTGYFAPGHDARLHGWIAKLSDGRMEPKDIPYASTRAKLGLVATKTGHKATNPHFYKD